MVDADRTARLLASPHFRWKSGMACSEPKNGRVWRMVDEVSGWWHSADGAFTTPGKFDISAHTSLTRARAAGPIDEAATRGCMLELAREAWGEPLRVERWWAAGVAIWRVVRADGASDGLASCGIGASEIDALVDAILAAPPKEAP